MSAHSESAPLHVARPPREFRPATVLFGLLAGLAVGLLFLSGAFDRLEFALYDYVQATQTRPAGNARVAVVAIDDRSVARLGQWPFPRSDHARLIARLRSAGAKVIALDLLLTEPDRSDPAGDRALAAAIGRAGNVVLAVAGSYKTLPSAAAGFRLHPPFLVPLPELSRSAARFGHVLVVPEPDGAVRRIPLYVTLDGQRLPSLALQAATAYRQGLGPNPATDRAGRWWIDFRPQGGWATFSYADVLEGRFPSGAFRGKVVLVGAAGSGFADHYPTPVATAGNPTPGLIVHAQAVSDLVAGDSVRWAPRWLVLLLILLLSAVPGVVGMGFPTKGVAVLTATVAAGYAVCAYLSITHWGVWLTTSPVVFASVASGTLVAGRGALKAEQERARLRTALSRYLSPQVLAELLSRRTPLALGGLRTRVTVLFADLRGFTRFAEERTPEQAVQVLNVYLQTMATAVFACTGTLDKFTGDGVMALFGAPADLPAHARAGLHCAATILDAVRQLNRERRSRGEATLEVGIGLATGEALVGNIGSVARMDYTAVGDVVNLAARLEKEARPGEAVVLLETVRAADGAAQVGETESLHVRGRSEPVRVARLVTQDTDGQAPRR